jgi:hypothetical protein
MVTEYNKNIIMRRRMEAEKAALELEKAGAVQSAEVNAVEVKEEKPAVKENLTAEKLKEQPALKTEAQKAETKKKTDAEKLKKGKK